MARYPELSLLAFQNRFPNEQACWEYVIKLRWPEGCRCPKHPKAKVHFKPSTRLFECYECGWQTSATAGTLFHKSKIPLRKWFWAIFLMATSSKGVSMRNLQKHLRIKSYRAVWLMGHKIRHAMIHREGLYRLKGNVQADEISIGSQTYQDRLKRREDRHTRFLMGVQESKTRNKGKDYPQFVSFEQLAAAFNKEMLPLLEKRIAKGSTLKTDSAGVFEQAGQHGYKVEQVTFTTEREKAKEHLKWIHWLSSNLKRGLVSTYHGCFPKYRKAYLAEFAYRFNRRYWPHLVFDRLLLACLKAPKITERELTD
jgi:hypothetical protein